METYHYKGFWNCDSKCGLEIKRDNEKATVILTELKDNPGASITSIIEGIATLVYKQFLSDIPVENITWIERSPPSRRVRRNWETLTIVSMDWNGKEFRNPKWERRKA